MSAYTYVTAGACDAWDESMLNPMFGNQGYPGFVYVFENPVARRVKVGTTFNNVSGRLADVNDKWLGRKVTCQVCGGRLVRAGKIVPYHVNAGFVPGPFRVNRTCEGAGEPPFEIDIALAVSYREKIKGLIDTALGIEKASLTRIANTLGKRIDKFRNHNELLGRWRLAVSFYMDNAESIERRTHKVLAAYLDKGAPIGEVFACSVAEATNAIESVLRELGLLHLVKKQTPDAGADSQQILASNVSRLEGWDIKASSNGPFKSPEGRCQFCGSMTSDWWDYDGKTGMCKCRSCRSQGKL